VKEDPKFGGQWNVPMFGAQWNVPSLVANGMFQARWPMECSNVWCPMEGEGKTLFRFFPLSPQQILHKLSIFSL
jgi:hypothetical protein